ncbi:diguanylate cyclase [Sphingobium sp.]|uniref:GGDEF domain-containing protein n=1 Tax=Sphingobium sp. TaxID=1912891 RepID=UPI003B3AD99C
MAGALDRASSRAIRPVVHPAVLPLGFLLLHAMLIAMAGDGGEATSLVFLVGAPLIAGMACLWRGWRAGWEGWAVLAIAMPLWAGGMVATVVNILWLSGEGEGGASILLYVLYGVPLIFALASPADDPWHVRMVDGILAAAMGYLFFRYVFTQSTMAGTQDANLAALRLLFDLENAYIAVFALIRLLACRDERFHGFLWTVSLYAVAYLLAAFYINHFEWQTAFGAWPDLIIDLPFLLLTILAVGEKRPAMVVRTGRRFGRVVRAGSPLLLPATLLTVAALLLREHEGLAVAGCIFATIGYGVRSILVQVHNYEEQDRLELLSHVDGLTGVANRRRFDEMLRRELARVRRQGGTMALIMVDIDHFKLLNDHHGHLVGDARLQEVAATLMTCARRGGDLVARYGGEEFAVLLPGADVGEAAVVAERMRAAVEAQGLVSPAPGGVVTVSIGLAQADPDGEEAQSLIDRADRALYEAKHGGRNRVGMAAVAAD